MKAPLPSFDHLARMTDWNGTFEHAKYSDPRREHGYCTDDMARVLVVASRQPHGDAVVETLKRRALQFVCEAQDTDGQCRNRKDRNGAWRDSPTTDDCWGRSMWGLGTAAARSQNPMIRKTALAAFERAAGVRSAAMRAMAFASMGAAEVLASDPDNRHARSVLIDTIIRIGPREQRSTTWPWPEPRLSYANAVVPEALIAGGVLLGSPCVLHDGLNLLGWLLDRQVRRGHLSVVPVGGAGPGDRAPAFDQQPIEVAAIADACARAMQADRSERWGEGLHMAIEWFLGRNDADTPMFDARTGGGFDGLGPDGPNLNQGAESTLAVLSTLQHGIGLEVGLEAVPSTRW